MGTFVWFWVDAGGLGPHVTMDLDCIPPVTPVRVNPVLSGWKVWMSQGEVRTRLGRGFLISCRFLELFKSGLELFVGRQDQFSPLLFRYIFPEYPKGLIRGESVRALAQNHNYTIKSNSTQKVYITFD